MENEDVIRQQMSDTRTSLTEKLETLEDKLLGTVEETSQAVSETVANVKESVHDGVEAVKDAMDIGAHVDRHPWLIVGGSVLCGYVLGSLLTENRQPARIAQIPIPPGGPKVLPGNGNGRHKHHKPQAQASSSNWLSFLEPEINKLKGLALGATLGTVREMISAEAPPHMAEQLREVIDDVTRKLGGEPIPSSDWTDMSTSRIRSTPAAAPGACSDETAIKQARFEI